MSEPIEVTGLNHVALRTRNLEASRQFYIDVLGCREISRPPFDFAGAWLYVAGMQFHLIEDPETPLPSPEIATRVNHIAFHVNDLDAMAERLTAHGIPYRSSTIPERNIRQVFFRDPDGWTIEIGSAYWTIDR